jgi:hypothetical protein
MEAYREVADRKDGLTPVQQGVKRGLRGLYEDELPNSSRIDALMKRLEEKERTHF